MYYKIFDKEDWINGLHKIEGYKVFVPVKENYYHIFLPIDKDITPDFSFHNTKLSPKSIIYPQSERMFEFVVDPEQPDAYVLKEVPKEFPSQAVVGIRPCDAHAFQIVKVNFDNPEYKDPWWTKRYEATTFIGLGCNRPRSTCFCTKVGGGPFNEKGLDAIMYDLRDRFLIKVITDKGGDFIGGIKGGKDPQDRDIKEAESIKEEAEKEINSNININMNLQELAEKPILAVFDAPIWDKVSFPCINCGICTYLCPTCWCFDIQDEVYKKNGDRIRNWDSCMFPIFTLHGSGHNPRAEKFRRVRQRFMHKLKYYVEKYGDGVQCSGCGRCVRYCPTNMDIREICNIMAK